MTRQDVRSLFILSKRHSKLYFKDKGAFFSSLITPLILIVLFLTFLKSVYESSVLSVIPEGVSVSKSVISAFSGCWLFSSIVGVSCVTIAFCSNIIMATDKVNKNINDFSVTPLKQNILSFSYLLSNLFSTLIVCYTCVAVGFVYIAMVGWFFSIIDVFLILLTVFLTCLFGCSLACLVEYFISTNGGITAVATLFSSLYGFICGAYMPLSQFSPSVRNFISLLPGTYTIGLLRTFYMNGVIKELSKSLPAETIKGLKDNFDANLYFFGTKVEPWQMFIVVISAILVFTIAFSCFVLFGKNKAKHKVLKVNKK